MSSTYYQNVTHWMELNGNRWNLMELDGITISIIVFAKNGYFEINSPSSGHFDSIGISRWSPGYLPYINMKKKMWDSTPD